MRTALVLSSSDFLAGAAEMHVVVLHCVENLRLSSWSCGSRPGKPILGLPYFGPTSFWYPPSPRPQPQPQPAARLPQPRSPRGVREDDGSRRAVAHGVIVVVCFVLCCFENYFNNFSRFSYKQRNPVGSHRNCFSL